MGQRKKAKAGLSLKKKRGSVTRVMQTGAGPIEIRHSSSARMRILYGKVEGVGKRRAFRNPVSQSF